MAQDAQSKGALQALTDLVASAQTLQSPLGIITGLDAGYKARMIAALHKKGCTTAVEVSVLLMYGLADGAMARWRTLYEIELIATFLAVHDEEVAERYFDHAAIKNWDWMRSILTTLESMSDAGDATPSEVHVARIRQKRDEAVSKYGPKFKYEYGWAANVVGVSKRNGPNRGDLEKSLGRANMTSMYKDASYQVHPMANAVIALPGAGTQGMALPGMMTAGSLKELTRTFIVVCTDPGQQLAATKRVSDLADEAVAAFVALP